MATSGCDVQRSGEVTVPGRKLLDICRALPEGAEITLTLEGERMIGAGAQEPVHAVDTAGGRVPDGRRDQRPADPEAAAEGLQRLLEKTHFSMAQQDVRYYLNGLLLETGESAPGGRD